VYPPTSISYRVPPESSGGLPPPRELSSMRLPACQKQPRRWSYAVWKLMRPSTLRLPAWRASPWMDSNFSPHTEWVSHSHDWFFRSRRRSAVSSGASVRPQMLQITLGRTSPATPRPTAENPLGNCFLSPLRCVSAKKRIHQWTRSPRLG